MKQIKLENFRCYTDLVVNFKSGINLLVGDNASGKTSIIKACRYILSSFFAGFSDDNTKWSNKFSKDDFMRIYKDDGRIVPLKPIKIKFVDSGDVYEYERESFDDDEQNIIYITTQQELSQGTKNGNKIKQLGIKGYIQETAQLSKTFYNNDERVKPLPLFAYFAAKDYENTNAQAKRKFGEYYHLASFGYYECLDTKINFNNWIYRLLVLEWKTR